VRLIAKTPKARHLCRAFCWLMHTGIKLVLGSVTIELSSICQQVKNTMIFASSRYLRMALPVTLMCLLTACDTSTWLPPDARLPDGSTYSGEIHEGLFHGEGVQRFASGMVYRGQFLEGAWHGLGELESPVGWRYVGDFQNGLMTGQGVMTDRRTRYEGEFENDLFHGHGRYETPYGDYIGEFAKGEPVRGQHVTEYATFEGEFIDWQYHGVGTLVFTDDPEGTRSVSGTWEYGQLLGAEDYFRDESPQPLTERILAEDNQRLTDQIQALAAERPGETDVYFLAMGGDGTESVFMRDIAVARNGLQAQFDLDNRLIELLNHRDYERLPLATRPSLARALNALDERMNPEEDLLVVHLVSHGGKDGSLLLRQPGLELPDLTPDDFARMLEALGVRRKVLVVSACYSGNWLNRLKDENTLILTSSRDDRVSFGCGDDSEMTWFTRALYQSVGLSLASPDQMFDSIQRQIREWEEEQGMEEMHWSYPQFHLGEDLREWLAQRFEPGH
jgi:hypothetical protein